MSAAVEQGGLEAEGGESVALSLRDALDKCVDAQPAQVVDHAHGADLRFGEAERLRNQWPQLSVRLIVSSPSNRTSVVNPVGRMQLAVPMVVAEFERGRIKERVNAGLAARKVRGVQLRRPQTTNGQAAEARKPKPKGLGPSAIGRELKIQFIRKVPVRIGWLVAGLGRKSDLALPCVRRS